MNCDKCGSVMRTLKKVDMGEVYRCDNCGWAVLKFNTCGFEQKIGDIFEQ